MIHDSGDSPAAFYGISEGRRDRARGRYDGRFMVADGGRVGSSGGGDGSAAENEDVSAEFDGWQVTTATGRKGDGRG